MPRVALVVVALVAASCGDDASGPNETPGSTEAIAVVSGAAQTGISGFELGDSIAVRVEKPSGSPLAGVPITWTATGGVLSSAQSVTDAAGRASVAWRIGPGGHTITAARPGLTATATAIGLNATSCGFSSTATNAAFPAIDTTWFRPTTRPLRVAALFIDFPDLAATRTVAQMMTDIIDPGVAMLAATSDGQLALDVVAATAWMRMPENASDLRWNDFSTHRDYIETILARFDAAFDFSTTDVVWIFRPSRFDPQGLSAVMQLRQDDFWALTPRDGREMRSFATFGADLHLLNVYNDWPQYGVHVLAHESGHVYGLPDLYAYASDPGIPWDGLRFTGGWSFMGWVAPATSWFAAERLYVGVMPQADALCPPAQPHSAVVTLRPLLEGSGLRAIGFKPAATRITFLEVRQRLGMDAALCATGLLVYDVNASARGGAGPITVREMHASAPGPLFERCGNKWNAPAQVGDVIAVGNPDVTVTVLSQTGDGAMKLRMTRQ